MKSLSFLFFFLMLSCSFNFSNEREDLEFERPRILKPFGKHKITAAFFKIHNNSSQDMKLIGASGDFSDTMELHTHVKENGTMKMRQVPYFLIKAQGSHELKRGADHIMIFNLKEDAFLSQKSLKIKLTFEGGKKSFDKIVSFAIE